MRRPLPIGLIGAALLVLPLLLTLALAGFVRARSAGRVHTLADAPSADVAIVLGAQVLPDGTPSRFLTARLEVARQLWVDGRVRALVTSGDDDDDSHHEPTAMKAWLVTHGVPADRIVVDPHGYDTYDTCSRASRIYGLQRFLLVSQRYHLPRAVATCASLGLDVAGVGDETVSDSPVWRQGVLRERMAAWKMAWDLLSHRDPVLGPPSAEVRQAVGS